MREKRSNYAYIDGANLYQGILSSGWRLDYRRFRVWLLEKYGVKTAYILSASSQSMETSTNKRTEAKIAYINDQRSNLELIQKEKAPDGDGTP